MKTPLHQDAEDHFQLFLAGYAVPAKILRELGTKQLPQDEEERTLVQCGKQISSRISTRRQFWLLFLAVCEIPLKHLAQPFSLARMLQRRLGHAATGGLT